MRLILCLENYSKIDSSKDYDIDMLERYIDIYNINDSKDEWFNRVKEFSISEGYSPNVKEYKKDPDKYKGHVGDVCEAIRVMTTGRDKSPDLYEILRILGKDKLRHRLELFRKHLNK